MTRGRPTPERQVQFGSDANHIRHLSSACEEVLAPIARQFLDLGLGASLFVHLAKQAYVTAATEAIRGSGQRPTMSRMAAVTGLHRKEIKAITRADVDEAQISGRLPPTMRVIAAWRADRDYVSQGGRPRMLRLEGGKASFRALVERYAGDVTYVAMLRELQRLGWVKRTPRGAVVLNARAHELKALGQMAAEFASRISAYASALAAKSNSEDHSSYAGYREAAPLDSRVGAVLARTFSKRAEEFLNTFDRWVARSGKNGARSSTKTQLSRFGVGVYLVDRTKTGAAKTALVDQESTRRAKRA
jgi:hypothetical protein